jgi:polyhydroxyalkanoate synthesis regulator phasin
MNHDELIAKAQAEFSNASDELKHYRLFEAKQQSGYARKQKIRELTNRRNRLKQRLKRLQAMQIKNA